MYFGSIPCFARERPAKGSCCVRLLLGPSCLSRWRCRGVAGALPGRCRRIENLVFPKENSCFFFNLGFLPRPPQAAEAAAFSDLPRPRKIMVFGKFEVPAEAAAFPDLPRPPRYHNIIIIKYYNIMIFYYSVIIS